MSSKPDIAANAISVTIISNQLEDTSDDNGNHSANDDYSKLIETFALHISEATIASNKPDIAVNAILVTTIFNQLEDRSDDNGNHLANDDYSKFIETFALHISVATITSNKPDITANAILVTIIFIQLEDKSDDKANARSDFHLLERGLQQSRHIFLHKKLRQTNLTLKKISITTYPLVHSTRYILVMC